MTRSQFVLQVEHQCSACKKWKPVSEFNRNKATLHGLQHQCRACQKLGRKTKRPPLTSKR